MKESKTCCQLSPKKKSKNFLTGLFYGLLPHSFCIAFIILSIIGATVTASFFKRFLLLPYFFEVLVSLSLIFATISAIFYLKRNNSLSKNGLKDHWRYLGILYGTTIGVNLFFFLTIFPFTANLNLNLNKSQASVLSQSSSFSSVTIQVQIPCSGHASLIIDELQKNSAIGEVKFLFPNRFEVKYDSTKISLLQILSFEIFKTYPAQIIN